MKNICCILCRKEYSHKGIYTHYDRAHLGKTHYSSGHNGKYEQISLKRQAEKNILIKEYKLNPKRCTNCNKVLDFDVRGNKFCSSSCSASFNNKGKLKSLETRRKISKKLSGKPRRTPIECELICIGCNRKFTHTRKKKYCSIECKKETYLKNLTEKKKYWHLCQFNFSLNDYPDKFDFSLIEANGWYKASNKGNNPTGISRDHMISINYGWKNGIPPEVISHPANCQLMPHNENFNKKDKCSITVEELYNRIKNWED
jgi:hypothetical protein